MAKDKADGSAYSKTYVVMINAVNSTNYADGYMLQDTITPDGYQVGSDGAWIQ